MGDRSCKLAQWLSITIDELEWFADLKGLNKKTGTGKLEHYCYRMMRKRCERVRLIEMPKPRLKEGLFRTLGYPEDVANRLGRICSNAVSGRAWTECPEGVDPMHWSQAALLFWQPHLAQGAPTSPSLANITAYRLDWRLSGLAASAGAQYTRYAADLAFSGNEKLVQSLDRFSPHVSVIAMEEGFDVNFRKTRLMRRGVRQHLAGVVVNEGLTLKRRDLDKLEAVLTNAVRHGPTSHNREGVPDFRSHLEGRVSFVQMVNRTKAAPLQKLLSAINWSR